MEGGGKRTLFCEDNRLPTAIPHDFQPLTDIDARMGEFRMGDFFPFLSRPKLDVCICLRFFTDPQARQVGVPVKVGR